MELDIDENVLKDSNQDRVTTVENLASRDWNRETLGKRFGEVRNNRDTIQSIIQDLVEEFESIPGESDLDSEWSGYLDQKGVDPDNKKPDDDIPAAYFLMTKRKVDALIRISVWQARLEELENFALQTFRSEYEVLLEEYRKNKSYDAMEDLVSDVALTGEDKAELEEKLNLVEKLMSRLFEQQKSIQKRQERLAEEDGNSLSVEKVKDGSFEALEEFTDEYGLPTLNPDEIEAVNKREERDEAAESAASDMVESTEDQEEDDLFVELKGKDLSKQAELLSDLAEELRPSVNDAGQQDVADRTDVTRQAIYSEGGILERCHDEGLFPGVDV